MQERKDIMDAKSDAVITLPGGFGTLEETLEMITLKQLGYHNKPVVLLNTSGYYDGLLAFFEHLYAERFAPKSDRKIYHVANNPAKAMELVHIIRS